MLSLVYDTKDLKIASSARWHSETNLNLCLVTTNIQNIMLPNSRKVIPGFLHSKHRPIIINIGIQFPLIRTTQKWYRNLRKADWESYQKESVSKIHLITPSAANYNRFVGMTITIVKWHIPHGYRKDYTPSWNEAPEYLYREYSINLMIFSTEM